MQLPAPWSGASRPFMPNLGGSPWFRWPDVIARRRVTLGFVVAAAAFWLATPSWGSLWGGTLIAAVGEALRVWAAGHLRKRQEVTTSGPYRFTRHPLYCGSLVIGIGFVVAAASPPVAVIVLAYLAGTLLVAVRLEEAALRRAFGQEYARYVRGTGIASGRRFSLERAMTNGEHRSLLGFFAAVAILGAKVWLVR